MVSRYLKPTYGALILRVGVGFVMLLQHGLPKLISYSSKKSTFPDPLNVSPEISLILVIFAELLCSIFLILGLKTRLSSIPLIITMAIAAFIIHAGDPWSKQELPIIYLICYSSLLFTGGGKFSLKD